MAFFRLEKEILDRYLDVVLKGNRDGLKVNLGFFFFFFASACVSNVACVLLKIHLFVI